MLHVYYDGVKSKRTFVLILLLEMLNTKRDVFESAVKNCAALSLMYIIWMRSRMSQKAVLKLSMKPPASKYLCKMSIGIF